ncbi:MAG: hypothetical protein WCV91_05575 [Candidatus Margulisiibacteriota bacterium]
MKKILLLLALIASLATSSLALTVGYESGMPYLRFGSIANGTVDLGFSSDNTLNGTYNDNSVMVRFNKEISKINSLKLGWALELLANRYFSSWNGAPETTLTYSGLFTAEYAFSEQVGVYANFDLISYQKTELSGANTAALAFLAAPGSTFTGVRFYF